MPVLSASEIYNLLSPYQQTCRGRQQQEVAQVLTHLHSVIEGPFASDDNRPYTFVVTLVQFTKPLGAKPFMYYYAGASINWGESFRVDKQQAAKPFSSVVQGLCNQLDLPLDDDYGGSGGLPLGTELVAVQVKSQQGGYQVLLAVACRLQRAASGYALPKREDQVSMTLRPEDLFDNRHPYLMRRAAARIFQQLTD